MRAFEGVAAFRVDAMVHRSYELFGADARSAGVEMPDFKRMRRGPEKVNALVQRLAGNPTHLLTRIIMPTAEQAPARIAPWAKILARIQHAKGRDIAFYSPFLPDEIVGAYAVGFQNEVLGIEVKFTQGVDIKRVGNYFAYGFGRNPKVSLVERLHKDGHSIAFVAAGAHKEVHDLDRAVHPLIVNGYESIDVAGGAHCPARIKWDRPNTDLIDFSEPLQVGSIRYDLGIDIERQRFIESAESTL